MTYDELWRPLAAVYDSGEARAIVRYVLDVRFGLSATDVYCGKVTQLSADDQRELGKIMERLGRCEPVQYVLGQSEFCGRQFAVGPGVLIPRPETEDLCGWVVQGLAARGCRAPALLDVGTGSGCIAVTLALDVGGAVVTAWDVSADALRVASSNAARLGAGVSFARVDALRPPADVAKWNAVVSNPPYVRLSERRDMERNVLDYEPEGALFVPDDDPLLFYRAIAGYAATALRPGGELYFEINQAFAGETCSLLRSLGFGTAEVRRDRFGRQRFAKATLR